MAEISDEPNSVTLVINQGSTLSLSVAITETGTDFTAYTGRAKIRASFATAVVLQALTVTVVSAGVGFINLTISLTAVETAALANTTAGERRQTLGVYDLEITNGTIVRRMMQGSAILSREATT